MSEHETNNKDRTTGQRLVSLRQLAREWSCSRQTVRRALRRAGVTPYFLSEGPNGTLRYSRAEVDAFLESCKGREVPMEK